MQSRTPDTPLFPFLISRPSFFQNRSKPLRNHPRHLFIVCSPTPLPARASLPFSRLVLHPSYHTSRLASLNSPLHSLKTVSFSLRKSQCSALYGSAKPQGNFLPRTSGSYKSGEMTESGRKGVSVAERGSKEDVVGPTESAAFTVGLARSKSVAENWLVLVDEGDSN